MMDSNLPVSPCGNYDTKNAFRKPSGDAANRNYRRRSPVDGSPPLEASPRHGHSSSPNPPRENSTRVSHHHSRKSDDREQDQQYGRNHYGRSSDSLRHFDRQSSKSSYGHSRHDKYANEDRYHERLSSRSGHESRDDHLREESVRRSKNYQHSMDKYSHDKYDRSDHRSKEKYREMYWEHKKYKDTDSSYDKSASGKRHALYDEVEREGRSRDWDDRNERRDSHKSSGDYRSDQAVCYSDSRNQRNDSGPQRDSGKFSLKEAYKSEQKESNDQNLQSEEKRKHDDIEIGNDRDRKARNERRDSHKSSGDYRSDQAVCYSDSRNQRNDSGPQRDSGKFSLKEAYKSEQKESNDQYLQSEEKRKHDDIEIGKDKDRKARKTGEQCGIGDKESSEKKLKLFDPDKDDNYRKYVSCTEADKSKTSSSKLSHESKADLQASKSSGFDGDNDLDAAKVAAMRAAELVNRNLVGAGCLTTDQKKKLLWGGKRSTPTEESGHRWDTAMFSDRERQEKFSKLMGMRGEAKVEQNSNNQSSNDILRAEKQKELQMDLEKQYTAGLRRRDGRTVGLGL